MERLAYRPLRGSFRLAPLITAIGEAEAERIAKASWVRFGPMFLEVMRFPKTKGHLAERVEFEAETVEAGVRENTPRMGTFTFEIKETKEDEEGITYDETVYTLVIVVTDTDGKLEIVDPDMDADKVRAPQVILVTENLRFL